VRPAKYIPSDVRACGVRRPTRRPDKVVAARSKIYTREKFTRCALFTMSFIFGPVSMNLCPMCAKLRFVCSKGAEGTCAADKCNKTTHGAYIQPKMQHAVCLFTVSFIFGPTLMNFCPMCAIIAFRLQTKCSKSTSLFVPQHGGPHWACHRGSQQPTRQTWVHTQGPLILLYYYSDGNPTGSIITVPTILPSRRVGCTAPPTNLSSKSPPAPTITRHSRRCPYASNIHYAHTFPNQRTRPTNTPHKPGLQAGRTSWQDQIGHHLKHEQQHIITHKTLCHRHHTLALYTQLPATDKISSHPAQTQTTHPTPPLFQNRSHFNQPYHETIRKEISNKEHKPSQSLLPPVGCLSLQNNRFEFFRHLDNICHVDEVN
jgi:hypothetical protein